METILENLKEKDREQMLRILMDTDIKKTYMIPDYEDEREYETLFERYLYLSNDGHSFIKGIYLDDLLIGIINQTEVNNDTIEVGYAILGAYENKGYATFALKTAINILFDQGYKAITAGYFIENAKSLRVMEKANMKPMDKSDEIEYRGIVHKVKYCITKKEGQ